MSRRFRRDVPATPKSRFGTDWCQTLKLTGSREWLLLWLRPLNQAITVINSVRARSPGVSLLYVGVLSSAAWAPWPSVGAQTGSGQVGSVPAPLGPAGGRMERKRVY